MMIFFFNGLLLPYTHSIFFGGGGLFSSPRFYNDYNKISNSKITSKRKKQEGHSGPKSLTWVAWWPSNLVMNQHDPVSNLT